MASAMHPLQGAETMASATHALQRAASSSKAAARKPAWTWRVRQAAARSRQVPVLFFSAGLQESEVLQSEVHWPPKQLQR